MNIIDAHVHAFPERLFEAIWQWFDTHGWHVEHRLQADEVVAALKQGGVNRFVVLNYAHKAGMSESLNAWTHAFAQKHPEVIPFGAIHPDDADRDALLDRCFKDYGFYGLKFHSHVSGIRPDDPRMFPIYEKMIEHDRPLTLHAGTGPSLNGYSKTTCEVSGAAFVRPVLKRYPDLKLIIPHLGADEIEEFFGLMREFPNLYMDTTMALSGYFPIDIPWDLIEEFAGRVLYGSDFPNLPYEARRELEVIASSPLSDEAKQKILSGTAQKLLQVL